jgi:hypothetical protein
MFELINDLKKIINYKVLDLVESYNFDTICLTTKPYEKVKNIFTRDYLLGRATSFAGTISRGGPYQHPHIEIISRNHVGTEPCS